MNYTLKYQPFKVRMVIKITEPFQYIKFKYTYLEVPLTINMFPECR